MRQQVGTSNGFTPGVDFFAAVPGDLEVGVTPQDAPSWSKGRSPSNFALPAQSGRRTAWPIITC
jgi:hypothetical protein